MTSAPAEPPAPDAPDLSMDGASTAPAAMPRDSSPTWELEMLISGAVTFSLFQLPPLLTRFYEHWAPHLSRTPGIALLAAYNAVTGALYTLIAAFVVHLGVRAYWVGLIGLDSVFPDGIRWERVLMVGPTTRSVLRERLWPLPRIIAQLDNFASIIFSFAFLIVLVVLVTLPALALAGMVAYGISALAFGGRYFERILGGLFALLFVPAAVMIYDMKRGARLDPASAGGRRLRRLVELAYRTQLMGVTGPVLHTIGTSARRKTAYAVFYVALLGSGFVVVTQKIATSGLFVLSGARFFSTASDANTVHYVLYESAWSDDHVDAAAPSIQDDVIVGPYVRLFIPYQMERHDLGVAAVCPRLPAIARPGLHVDLARQSAAGDSAAAHVLHCLAALHAVRLNGERIPDLRFHFARHPRTGVDGIVAYIPTAPLPHGENVLTVMPPPRLPGPLVAGPLEPYVIPFWY